MLVPVFILKRANYLAADLRKYSKTMKTMIQIWTNPTFGEIRTMNDELGNTWFVGKDVALALGYVNPQKAIRDHVNEVDKTVNVSFTVNGTSPVLINESGLYALVLSSKLPQAREFKHWVTSVVLPQIRKTGGYIPTSPNPSQGGEMEDTEILSRALLIAQKTIEMKNNLLESQRPMVQFAKTVKATARECTIEELAKMITNAGVQIGQNRLFSWLRNNHYLGHSKAHFNIPYQDYIDQGLFKLRITEYTTPKGRVDYSVRTLVTPKGQEYFIEVFTEKKEVA